MGKLRTKKKKKKVNTSAMIPWRLMVLGSAGVAVLAWSTTAGTTTTPEEEEEEEGGPPRRIAANLTTQYVTMATAVRTFPHDTSGFTQGLVASENRLFESDGLYGKSRVREVEPSTGRSRLERPNKKHHFGEGLAAMGDRLVQLTWREKVIIEYSLDLEVIRTLPMPLPREGWGAAWDGRALYLSDGSATVRKFGMDYAPLGSFEVKDHRLGITVEGLNELEMVSGELWANVYAMRRREASNCIARVNPATGDVLGWIDANSLFRLQSDRVRRRRLDFVFNGIAFLPGTKSDRDDHLYVTGKMWDNMFDIDLLPTNLGPAHVKLHCGLYFPTAAAAAKAAKHSPPHHHHHRCHDKETNAA
ncbi:hypothetical protein CTAYLR_009582 [Chrysophaeum taylorii]|uniref:Glutamine cyclotransferase n=1 Tax=Chrysophaeum taylorii TaxID=2483200 RepID=A0AAD7XRX4_9STRA|nr:hypothetical protein CTAYLR_009582 [Chrysophaeum taylorii]